MVEVFDFNEYAKNREKYSIEKELVKNNILTDYDSRKTPVTVKIGETEVEKTLGFVLLNLILFAPFVGHPQIQLDINDLFDKQDLTADGLNDYINHVINRFKENIILINKFFLYIIILNYFIKFTLIST